MEEKKVKKTKPKKERSDKYEEKVKLDMTFKEGIQLLVKTVKKKEA